MTINAIRKFGNHIIFNNRWDISYTDEEYDENWIIVEDGNSGETILITRSTLINGQLEELMTNLGWPFAAVESVICFDDWAGELPE